MKDHIDLLSDSSSSDDCEEVSKDNVNELNSYLSKLNLDNTRETIPKSNQTKNQNTKRRLIKKKDHQRLQSYRNIDESSDSGRSIIQSDSESDDNSIMSTKVDRQKLVSKVATKSQKDDFVDLVDTSDDDHHGGNDDHSPSDEHDWISLDDSSTSSDGDDDFEDKRVRMNQYVNGSRSEKKRFGGYEQTSAIQLSDDDDDDEKDSISTSLSTNESINPSFSWIKTKWKGSLYYTLPRAAPSDDSNGKQINHPDIYIPSSLFKKMYDHQKVGVEWISSLHVNGIGGILGDDMGLGKTLQTLSFLGGLMTSKSIRNALVVCPKSLLLNWEREARDVLISHCKLRVVITVVDSNISQDRRERTLKQALKW